jgi:hypothetical protein
VLAKKWDGRDVAMKWVNSVAFVLLAVGFALTFPPLTSLLLGK